jgi:uncharacterized membrane protein
MYEALKVAHVVGVVVLGLGLAAVWVLDFTGRRARSLDEVAAAARRVALAYDVVVVPGALVMMASGGWMIATIYGSAFLEIPWLAAMVILFSLEFLEGNIITRLFFLRLRRVTAAAASGGHGWPPEAQGSFVPSFTHFLDIPVFALVVYLGVLKPTDWSTPILGCALAIAAALTQTMVLRPTPRPSRGA